MSPFGTLGLHIRTTQMTVDFVKKGSGVFCGNGQERKIVIPRSFQRELVDYCKRSNMEHGAIFRSQRGTNIHRITINAARSRRAVPGIFRCGAGKGKS